MQLAAQLWQLQEADLEIQHKQRRLAEVEKHLGESEIVASTRRELEAHREKLQHWQTRQRDLELEIQGVTDRIRSSNRQLMSGRVHNLKELEGLQASVQALRRRRSALEDDVLEAMLTIDDLTQTVAALEERLAGLEAEWQARQAMLEEEREQLLATLKSLETRRQTLSSEIGPEMLALYEHLRQRKGGRPVARVEGSSCQVCGVSLSIRDIQDARYGDSLVFCSNCERILYAP